MTRLDSITVSIARTGGEVKTIAMNRGAAVVEVLEKAGISLSRGEVIARNGSVVTMETAVSDKDILFIEANDENGAPASSITVSIARTGGEVKTIAVNRGTTVVEVLEKTGISLSRGEVVARNGSVVTMETAVSDKDVLFIEANDENGR